MRHMTMARFGFLEILDPLHQLAMLADLQRGQARTGLVQLDGKVRIPPQQPSGRRRMGEELPQDLHIHRRTVADRSRLSVGRPKRVLR